MREVRPSSPRLTDGSLHHEKEKIWPGYLLMWWGRNWEILLQKAEPACDQALLAISLQQWGGRQFIKRHWHLAAKSTITTDTCRWVIHSDLRNWYQQIQDVDLVWILIQTTPTFLKLWDYQGTLNSGYLIVLRNCFKYGYRMIGEGNGNPLQYSCLENSMDWGAWWAIQSMELQRVGHDSGTSLLLLQNDGYVYKYKHKPLSLCRPKSSFEFFHTTFWRIYGGVVQYLRFHWVAEQSTRL